ncbi:hypothetical protein HOLleu_36218 [Holothuria leucospilota]|uniref:Ig-like domain-containing protein n=1 Tax=Holothuria leucospilota TaxID=206669 RepID=A0A9Q1BDI1_HOLLE|nr:hypothetical protein HOLleu_36218 [Holothuria leucospilota]
MIESRNRRVRNEVQSGDGRFDNLIIWIVLSLAATFLTVLLCCVGIATRRVKDYQVQLYSEYLSKESYNYATSKLFSEKDICFILKMKMGHIYNRWMGTITVSKEVTKCIILSTGADTVVRKRELQWDKFVRKAITLPEATNLIKVQGIGINKGKLYLIHDFITGETLDEFISIPSYPTQVIGCVLGILDGMKVIQSYETDVLPELTLTVDENSSDVIYIEQEESVTITCDASGAKPKAELSWMINGYPVDETNFTIRRPSNVFTTLILQPRQNDTVKCTIFLPGPNKTKVDSVTFYVKVGNEEQSEDGGFDSLIIWVVLSLAATFMTVLVCCVGSATRRVKASKSSDLSASLQLTGTVSDRQVNGVSMTSRELPAIRQSMLLISPEIDNEEIYCDVEDKAEEVANVEMIVQLPGEGMFQYWTANATFNKDVRTKIIAKCVSDSVQLKDHMKFKTLAESVATLNKHRNIIDILGVSTANVLPEPIVTVDDNSPDVLYVHIEQEERVTITCDASGAKPQAQLRWMINGHPVDETNFKILRNEGQSEDGRFDNLIIWVVLSLAATFMTVLVCCVGIATRRVKDTVVRKREFQWDKFVRKAITLPEATNLIKVQGIGINKGTPPFSNEQQFPCNDKVSFTLSDKWPEIYNILRCEQLFECWNHDPFLRPSICQLQLSFKEV